MINAAKYVSEEDGKQNYSEFQQLFMYFKTPANNNNVKAWKSEGLSNQSIKPGVKTTVTSDTVNPRLDHFNNPKFRVEFDVNCLKTDQVTFTRNKITNLYTTYEIKHGDTTLAMALR